MNKFQLGVHIGSNDLNQFNLSLKNGVTTFQFFVGDPQKVEFEKPNSMFSEFLEKGEVLIVHSPYWSTMFKQRLVDLQAGYIKFISSFYASKALVMIYVMHTGVPGKEDTWDTMKAAYKNFFDTLVKRNSVRNMMICVENDSGYKGHPNYTIDQLCDLADGYLVAGVTLDTEHLYAAGEKFDDVPWDRVQMIHLNAIPRYVAFGGHLDRHSWELLDEGKQDIQVALKHIKEEFKGGPIIFERRDVGLALKDVDYMRKYFNA